MLFRSLDVPATRPRYGTIVNLLEAIAAVSRIAPDSPFAAAGQAYLPSWQSQLEDLRWLKFADLVAQLGHRASYELAIQQAQRVAPGHPRRLQGQTLIADWRVRMQRLEDRPTLVLAQQLAQPGTIAALQAATAKASQIELGRPLRIEAQTLMAEWQQEIEDGLRQAQVVVSLLSPHAVRRVGDSDAMDSVCLDELTFARTSSPPTPVVPAMVVPCEPPFIIYRLDYVHLHGWKDSEEEIGRAHV